MADLLEQIREELSTRLAELHPLIDEQRRLEAALHALGGEIANAPAATSGSAPPPPKTRTRKPKPAKPRKRAPRGANREAVLRAVEHRAGATSAELAAVSGVERNTVYGLLARLVKEGELQTRTLPTGRTGYALATTRSTSAAAAND
jgi:transposase